MPDGGRGLPGERALAVPRDALWLLAMSAVMPSEMLVERIRRRVGVVIGVLPDGPGWVGSSARA